MSHAEIYFDGGARPTNPGHSGFGVLVVHESGHETEIGRYVGWGTNNEAEYKGLIVGLKVALDKKATSCVITGDSLLVINTVQGEWKCKKPHLRVLMKQAQELLERFDSFEFVHVRGHQGHVENERVDTLATNAIKYGMTRKPNPFSVAGGVVTVPSGNIVDPFQ